mmetsp:Transcript_15793/g.34190  ORF Transcript_15793/g.34190 Transcript_15793/m.34190 type:complete len:247 (-) Transcript_15793:2309-3049(-)
MLQYHTSGRSSAEISGGSLRHFSHFSHWTHSTLSGSSSSSSFLDFLLPFLLFEDFFSFSESLPDFPLLRLRDEAFCFDAWAEAAASAEASLRPGTAAEAEAASAASPSPDLCLDFFVWVEVPGRFMPSSELPSARGLVEEAVALSLEPLATVGSTVGGLLLFPFCPDGRRSIAVESFSSTICFDSTAVTSFLAASCMGDLLELFGGLGLDDASFFVLFASFAFFFFSAAASCVLCSSASQVLRLGS